MWAAPKAMAQIISRTIYAADLWETLTTMYTSREGQKVVESHGKW
jgi:hypothetical protein